MANTRITISDENVDISAAVESLDLDLPGSRGHSSSSLAVEAVRLLSWSDLTPMDELAAGKGSFGVVFKGRLRTSQVAVKIFKMGNAVGVTFDFALVNMQREAQTLEKAGSNVENDYIVKYFGVAAGVPTQVWLDKIGRLPVLDESSGCMLALVTRFEGGGNLHDALHLVKPCVIPMVERLRILTEVATGLFHLHRAEGEAIIHGDIKSENVLFSTKGMQVRLADFGLSKVRQISQGADGASRKSSIVSGGGGGTWPYMAPELYDDVGISRSSDMYAFGTLCWEVLSGLEPWAGANEGKRLVEILKGKTLNMGALSPNTPPSVVDMIRLCLAFGEDDDASGGRNARPSIRVAREVLENAYDVPPVPPCSPARYPQS